MFLIDIRRSLFCSIPNCMRNEWMMSYGLACYVLDMLIPSKCMFSVFFFSLFYVCVCLFIFVRCVFSSSPFEFIIECWAVDATGNSIWFDLNMLSFSLSLFPSFLQWFDASLVYAITICISNIMACNWFEIINCVLSFVTFFSALVRSCNASR